MLTCNLRQDPQLSAPFLDIFDMARRSNAKPAATKAKTRPNAKATRTSIGRAVSKPTLKEDETAADNNDSDSGSGDDESDAYVDEGAEDDEADDAASVASLDSDALDDSDFDGPSGKGKKRKRASTSASPAKSRTATTKTPSPTKAKDSPGSAKKRRTKGEDDEDEEFEDLKPGQEVVGVVVEAPKTGRGALLLF